MIEHLQFGHVTVLGDVMLDHYISGTIERISPEAPVPVLQCKRRHSVAGGAANVAVNVAALSCDVALIGLVGMDASAHTLKKVLEEHGIDLSGMVTDPMRATTTKTRVLGGQQQIVRIDEEQTASLTPPAIDELITSVRRMVEKTDVLICSDYAKGVLGDDVLKEAIAAAREKGIPVIVDPKRAHLGAYAGATLITPNRKELHLVTGLPLSTDEEIIEAAKVASEQFGGDVLVTRSEDGMTLWRREESVVHVSADRSEVSDVSGAGDTVIATLASILSAGEDMETAVSIAAAAAAIVVRKIGTATVSRDELNRELRTENTGAEGALLPLNRAREVIAGWHHHGARVVFTNGCFDLLHPGHVALLQAAAKHGDKLIVAINSDASVKRLKGPERPIQDEEARAAVIGSLRMVDMVVLFDEDTPLETIQELRPDVVVKGADYREDEVVGGAFVKSYGGKVVLADLIDGRSTTSLVEKMRKTPRSS